MRGGTDKQAIVVSNSSRDHVYRQGQPLGTGSGLGVAEYNQGRLPGTGSGSGVAECN
jgi:hypothetical protein